MYYLVHTVSVIIRQFFVSNPFENAAIEVPFGPVFFNMIIGAALVLITYMVVGIFYKRRSSPAVGSMLFLLFYLVHNGLLVLMSKAEFNKILIGIKNSIFRNSLIFQGLPPIKYQNLMYFPLFLPL